MNGHTDDSALPKLTAKFADHLVVDGHVEYRILLKDSRKNESWTINSRYSDLRKVHSKLRELAGDNLPNFPRKQFFGNTEPSFISQRQKGLENYFSIVLQNQTLLNSKPIKELLQRKAYSKSIVVGKKDEQQSPKKMTESLTSINTTKADSPKTQRTNPTHHVLEKFLDQLSHKFVDLQVTLNPPEDEEMRKRKLNYAKIHESMTKASAQEHYKLPTSTPQMVVQLNLPSVSAHNPGLQNLLVETLNNTKLKMYGMPFLQNADLVGNIQ